MKGLGLALLLAFAFVAFGSAAELLYVLWYRRRFQRDSTASDDIERSVVSSALGSEPHRYGTSPPSKELLLYYLCYNNNSRIEPASGKDVTPALAVPVPPLILKPPPPRPPPLPPRPPPPPPTPPETARVEEEEEEEDEEESEKFRQLCTSRLLYTIREEEDAKASEGREQGLDSPPVEEADELVTEDEEDDATMLDSACASSFYSTPSSSPLQPTLMDSSMDDVDSS